MKKFKINNLSDLENLITTITIALLGIAVFGIVTMLLIIVIRTGSEEVYAEPMSYSDNIVSEQMELPVETYDIITPYQDEAWYLWHYCNDLDYDNFELAFAISRLETGNFETLYKTNNWGGLSINESPIQYQNIEDGVIAYIELLKKFDMDSPEELGKVWCPVNYDNWVKSVREIMQETKVESRWI